MTSAGTDSDFPLIADHGVIGDGRALALVDRAGTVDWCTLPEDEELAIFASLLDPRVGGRWRIAPDGPHEVEQRYLEDTAALRTTFRTGHGVAHVDDVFNLHEGAILPWVELARRVVLEEGTIDLEWELAATGRLGGEFGVFHEQHGRLRCVVDGLTLGVQAHGATAVEEVGQVLRGTIHLRADDPDALLALVAVTGEPLVQPDRNEIERRIDRTVAHWRAWSDGVAADGRWSDALRSSARTLKLLIQSRTGAPLAAATTSLPERIGGPRNFDYRYCWVRDASFTVDALLNVGLVEEAHSALVALLEMGRRTRPDLVPMYTATGDIPKGSRELMLRGYRDSKPVRCGNDARDQLQLGAWGHLVDAMWRYVVRGNDLDRRTRDLLRVLLDRLAVVWTKEDAGMWELPASEHYTISKLGAWTAFDRALRLADQGQLDGDTSRWGDEREAVRRFVEEHCWLDDRNTFRMHPGTDAIDASCLLVAQMEFGSQELLSSTIDAVQKELSEGPFVWRYSGMRDQEGAFLACSFWLVDALAHAGRVDEAVEHLDELLGAANHLGLYSEEFDPTAHESLGNFPQGLSHLGLINAAKTVARAIGE